MEKSSVTAFIEDAIKGGWKGQVYDTCYHCEEAAMSPCSDHVERVLLSRIAWQAVGRTRGWDKYDDIHQKSYNMSGLGGIMPTGMFNYVDEWQQFILLLADGKSIEEALASLTPTSEVK